MDEPKLSYKCVVCQEPIDHPAVCRQCHQPCVVSIANLPNDLYDVRSRCHNAHVDIRSTCSEAHHAMLVDRVEAEFGEFKRVVDAASGKAYRVPTRDIIERGLTYQDVSGYPEWD